MTKIITLITPILLLAQSFNLKAQSTTGSPEMKLVLHDNESHYLKWTFTNQVWFRYNESNPGTTVLGEAAPATFDIGLRRTRIQFFGQVSDHVFFYTQFGQNNFNFLSQHAGNRKLQSFFHDALAEYNIWKGNNALKLGGGLTITNGLSRFSQPSISTIMTMDVPVFAQATVDQTDEFSRKLSVYARGQIGKIDYRVTLSDPFPVTTNGQATLPLTSDATFAALGHHKQYQGFLIYNLFQREPHTTPYMTGSYLGKKKVLNLECGFIAQPRATWTRIAADADTVYHTMKLWSAALYYDAPLDQNRGTAISAYAGYFDYNFGPGYLRFNGIMNPANGVATGRVGGSQGNSFPMFGTGEILYAQAGYLFGKDLLGQDRGTLLPYVSVMDASFDKLESDMIVWNLGVNWLISSHTTKITIDYQHRPVFEATGSELQRSGSRGLVVVQYQVYL